MLPDELTPTRTPDAYTIRVKLRNYRERSEEYALVEWMTQDRGKAAMHADRIIGLRNGSYDRGSFRYTVPAGAVIENAEVVKLAIIPF